MLEEWLIRFVLGGVPVSAFAVLGDLFRPKTLAGIFGAAPSVALASLGLAFVTKGAEYAGIETRSMVLGAVALGCYGYVVGRVLLRGNGHTLLVSSLGLGVWFVVALALCAPLLSGQNA